MMKNELHRKALSKLRVSAHSLKIERGRYTTPKTPVEQRVCQHCPDKIEDEFHFLLQCCKYQEDREVMLLQISKICPNFKDLSNEHRFIYMLSAGTDVAEHVAKFTYKNLPK